MITLAQSRAQPRLTTMTNGQLTQLSPAQTTGLNTTSGTTSTRQQLPASLQQCRVSSRLLVSPCPCTHGCHCPATQLPSWSLPLTAVAVATAHPPPHPLPCPVTTAACPARGQGPHSKPDSWWSLRRNITTTDISADQGDWSWQHPWD